MTMQFRRALALVWSVAVLGEIVSPAVVLSQQAPPPAALVTPDPWPRTFSMGGAKYTLYQPQLKIVVGLVTGTEGTKAQVESGEYNRKIDARIAEIKSACGTN
jgi:hypothetical protein